MSDALSPIEITLKIEHIKALRMIIESYEKNLKVLEKELKDYMHDKEVLCDEDGVTLVTYKFINVSDRFDAKWFRAENPELYEKYKVESKEQRRFEVK